MELIDENDSIRCSKFKCLTTNSIYEIVNTKSVGRYVLESIDTILKDGELRRDFSRAELRRRFDNIQEIKPKDYTLTKKKKKKR